MSESEYEGLLPDEDAEAVAAPAAPSGEESASVTPDDEEIPPAPGEDGDLAVAPLAVREAAKLAGMTPEQRERYDAANAEIMSHPAVAAFAQEEDRARAAKEEFKAAFLAAYNKRKAKA